ncbi:TPA: hypothetical protein MEY30_001975 [Klebsiella pneumoniae]|nr:hypothetical protein [Klebsiella pneumoniae]
MTREESIQAVFDLKVGYTLGLADIEILKRVARMALAAMDSEPVAEVYQTPNVGICAALGPSIRMLCALEPGTKLYRHAQPAPVVPVGLEHLRSIVADPRLLPRRKEWIGGQQYSYVLLEEVEAIVDEACRAAMLAAAPQEVKGE